MRKTLAFAIKMVELENGRWMPIEDFDLEEIKYLKQIYGKNLKKDRGFIFLENPDKEGLI